MSDEIHVEQTEPHSSPQEEEASKQPTRERSITQYALFADINEWHFPENRLDMLLAPNNILDALTLRLATVSNKTITVDNLFSDCPPTSIKALTPEALQLFWSCTFLAQHINILANLLGYPYTRNISDDVQLILFRVCADNTHYPSIKQLSIDSEYQHKLAQLAKLFIKTGTFTFGQKSDNITSITFIAKFPLMSVLKLCTSPQQLTNLYPMMNTEITKLFAKEILGPSFSDEIIDRAIEMSVHQQMWQYSGGFAGGFAGGKKFQQSFNHGPQQPPHWDALGAFPGEGQQPPFMPIPPQDKFLMLQLVHDKIETLQKELKLFTSIEQTLI
jgi:hypothetical protein